ERGGLAVVGRPVASRVRGGIDVRVLNQALKVLCGLVRIHLRQITDVVSLSRVPNEGTLAAIQSETIRTCCLETIPVNWVGGHEVQHELPSTRLEVRPGDGSVRNWCSCHKVVPLHIYFKKSFTPA